MKDFIHLRLAGRELVGGSEEGAEDVQIEGAAHVEIRVALADAGDLQPLPRGPEIKELVQEVLGAVGGLAQLDNAGEEGSDPERLQRRLKVVANHLRVEGKG